jgi:hypothetical protein
MSKTDSIKFLYEVGITGNLEIHNSGDSAGLGPELSLDRMSASPASGDRLGTMHFYGRNDADEKTSYGHVSSFLNNVSNGAEMGKLSLGVIEGGSAQTNIVVQSTNWSGSFIGIEEATPAYTLDVGGDTRVQGHLHVDGRARISIDSISLTSSTTTQNINSGATDNVIEWNVNASVIGDSLSHAAGTKPIVIEEAGTYMISAHVSFATAGVRYNGRLGVRRNETSALGPVGLGGYTRNATSNNEGSLSVPPFIYALNKDDELVLGVDRETTVTDAVTLNRYESWFTVVRMA